MGFRVAEERLIRVGMLALIVIAGLIAIPGILAEFWLKSQSFASTFVHVTPGGLEMIALTFVTLVVGGWIILGLLKDEYRIGRGTHSPARKITYTKARRAWRDEDSYAARMYGRGQSRA